METHHDQTLRELLKDVSDKQADMMAMLARLDERQTSLFKIWERQSSTFDDHVKAGPTSAEVDALRDRVKALESVNTYVTKVMWGAIIVAVLSLIGVGKKIGL